jgi:four helix bundle protein
MQDAGERISSYNDLVVWQKSVELVTEVYRATSTFPREETFGLTSQLRRSAVSIPSNIAEGQGRATKGEFVQFLANARGSLFELRTQVHIAGALGFLSSELTDQLMQQADRVGRLLNGLIRSLGGTSRRRTTNH